MTGTRATITVGVDGTNESRRNIDSVADAMRRMNAESLANLSGQVGALGDRINGLQSRIGDIASYSIAGVSLGMLTGKVGDALDKFGDLDDMAQRTGASIENLSRLQKLAQAFGADFGTVGTALANLNKGLSGADEESSKTRKALGFLGVSARDSAGKLREPGELMIEIANRLQGYKDGAGKAALANDLFGKSGRELLPLMGDMSESIDKFSATSKESVAQATALQDKMGMLRVRSSELFTSIVVAGLPAMTDLADGISDVMEAQSKLAISEDSGWADAMAMGAARVVDVLALIPRVASAISSSFKVVGADIEFLFEVAKLKNPANVAFQFAKGNDPLAGIKKAASDRNKVLDDANAKYDRLWNQPANLVEQAVMKRLSDRKGAAQAPKVPKAPEPDKPDANYSSGKDSDAEAANKAAEAYRNLIGSIQAKIKQSQIEANTGKAATAAQQERLRVDEQLEKLNLGPKQRAFVEGLLQELETNNEVIESRKRAAEGQAGWEKIQKEWLDSNVKVLANATEEAARNEALALTFGMTKGAIEQMELARLKDQLAQRSSLGLTLDEIEHLEKLIAAKERNATAVGSIDAAEAAKKAGEDLDKFLDPTKAQTFGEALKGAFGAAGDSLTQLISNLDAYGIRQAEVDKARKDAATRFATDSKGYAAASEAISREELRSRVTAYGDMTAAAKGFFSEGSKGYQTLEATEKAFRAYELAMAGEAMLKKLFFKEAEVAAHTTLNATKLSGEAATTAASTGLAATEASAWGITAVVKAIASLPFPLNLAAGAATMAAVVAVGAKMFGGVGSSSISLSQSRQESQGTGSVFGDTGAKSESIARSLERVENNTYQGLAISMGMLSALTDIKGNIGSFATRVVRDTNITGKAPVAGLGQGSAEEFWSSDKASFLQGGVLGIALDKLTGGWLSKTTGKIMGAIFGGKTTLEDSGFTVGKTTLGAVASGGLNAMSYADIKKDGGWFRSDKMSTQLEGLGADGTRQITNVLLSLSDGIREAGIAVGLPTDSLLQTLNAFEVDIGKISFKDMKADEIEKTLQAVFSKLGDDMAQFAVGGLEQFQAVGEGYMETLVRVAQGYQSVDVVMQSMGMTFSAVGIDSIAARQRLLELAGGLDKFVQNSDQFMSDFYTDAERAEALRTRIAPTLDQFGIRTGQKDSIEQFRKVATGLDLTTAAGAQAFATLMQIAPAFKQIADVDAKGLEDAVETAKTKRQIEIEIMGLSGDAAGALAAQRALELAELDSSLRPLKDRAYALQDEKAALELSKSALSIQAQIYELTGDKAGAAAVLLQQQANALAELDPALRGATQNLWALEAAAKTTEKVKADASSLLGGVDDAFSALDRIVKREKSLVDERIAAEKKIVDKHQELSNSLRSTLDGMVESTQQLANRQSAQAQIQAALAIAKASGTLPDADALKRALTIVAQDSAALYATQQDYLRDFYTTQNDIASLADLTDSTLSIEEKSLKALEEEGKRLDSIIANAQEQINVLKGIDVTAMSIEQGIAALSQSIRLAMSNPVVSATGAINSTYQSTLGRAPDPAGLKFWQDRAAEGVSQTDILNAIANSAESNIKSMYQATLGRAADAAGLQFWVDQVNKGTSYAEIQKALEQSQEKLRIPGFADGGMFGGGLRIVGENGPELEATGPARIWNAGQTGDLLSRLSSPSDNSAALVAELRALRAEVAELRKANSDENYAIAKNTMNTADHLDAAVNGNVPLATKVIPA